VNDSQRPLQPGAPRPRRGRRPSRRGPGEKSQTIGAKQPTRTNTVDGYYTWEENFAYGTIAVVSIAAMVALFMFVCFYLPDRLLGPSRTPVHPPCEDRCQTKQ
jgi:hypothetical protein